jgi:hypothetical protein
MALTAVIEGRETASSLPFSTKLALHPPTQQALCGSEYRFPNHPLETYIRKVGPQTELGLAVKSACA